MSLKKGRWWQSREGTDSMEERNSFTKEEQYAALLIYRCVKPLWYTRVKTLKEAGNDLKLIQKCLDEMELAQTKEIDFRSVM